MPANLPAKLIENAETAVEFARSTRRYHSRRSEKGTPQRENDLTVALDRLRSAMKPLRSEIARFPYGPQTVTAENNREIIRKASAALQRERRKLWKMKKR